MIPQISIVFMGISALICIGLPITLFIIWRRKYGLQLVPVFVGIAAFILFKYILEHALHNFVLRPNEDGSFELIKNNPWLFVLYAIVVTGVFMESARFISFYLMKSRYRGVGTGLSYGIGHAGVESVLVIGVTMTGMVLYSLMINGGDLSVIDDTPEALEQIRIISNEFPGDFLISGLERILSMTVSLSLSIVMICAVTLKGKVWMYPAAIGAHALATMPLVMFRANLIGSIWVAQALVLVPTALIAYWAYKVCDMFPEEENNPPPVKKKPDTYDGPTL